MGNGTNQTKSHTGIIAIAAIIIVLALFGACGKKCNSSSGKSATCQVCHKTFTNSSDVSSIRWHNMCEKCYSNYKYTSELKESAKKYLENH